MRKFILIFFLFFNLYASVEIESLSDSNLEVLKSLDINPSFIKDRETNILFNTYLKRRKKYFLNLLENGYSYIPLIKKEINKANIPSTLVFVAMAESYFSTSAKSNKKAVGLWQFMSSTAKRFGLKINEYVDERRDPIKSTIAAIKYLSYLRKKRGKWYLAIMSYNCGEARVIEAIARAKLDKYCESHKCKNNPKIRKLRKNIKIYQHTKNFSKLYYTYKEIGKLYPLDLSIEDLLRVQKNLRRQYLPKETRRYIRKIVAMSFLLNSDKFIQYQNHYLLNRGSISNIVKVNVPAGTSLNYIAKILSIDYNFLRKNNAHLKYGFTPPNEDSYIYIPYEKLALFRMTFNNKKISKKIVYRVKKGDTLRKIAYKFGIKYKIIKDFNHLRTSFLRINQKLVIPISNKRVFYRVKKGDSLAKIALKFGTSYKVIKRVNNLKNSLLRVNQRLIIPINHI